MREALFDRTFCDLLNLYQKLVPNKFTQQFMTQVTPKPAPAAGATLAYGAS